MHPLNPRRETFGSAQLLSHFEFPVRTGNKVAITARETAAIELSDGQLLRFRQIVRIDEGDQGQFLGRQFFVRFRGFGGIECGHGSNYASTRVTSVAISPWTILD